MKSRGRCSEVTIDLFLAQLFATAVGVTNYKCKLKNFIDIFVFFLFTKVTSNVKVN